MGDFVVQARHLRKKYGEQVVVDNIQLEVKRGECFGLLGPNGAGKTTVLRMLLGLTPPDGGELKVLGCDIPAQARQMHERMGLVPQSDNLDPDFSVAKNLWVYARYFGVSRAVFEKRLPWLLAFASLESKADAEIDALSGGMKRRLTMARALVNDPDLIVLDEPTTGLDPQARQLIWRRLRELTAQGKTLILTTHYLDEAERLCDRLAIMDGGRILVNDSPQTLIREHIEPQVIEVYGQGCEAWGREFGSKMVMRQELVGETLFCYTNDELPVLASLREYPLLQFIHRRANLEDVFLKLTGKELRDA
ncbi:ATP-binding cassette domain-containing protein [Pseudomonadota bacterium]